MRRRIVAWDGRDGAAVSGDVLARLKAGFRSFRAQYYEQRPELYRALAEEGQRPQALVIACTDSRVDPAILLNAQPGELFVVRNVANLVPPYEPDGRAHSTSAAIEFAVRDLGVAHVVVLGHAHCGGIAALVGGVEGRDFIGPWMQVADRVRRESSDPKAAEQAAVGLSLGNLMTFPWLAERVGEGRLELHGWWFDLDEGALWGKDRPQDPLERLA